MKARSPKIPLHLDCRQFPGWGPVCVSLAGQCVLTRLSHGCVEGGEQGCFPKLSFASIHASEENMWCLIHILCPFWVPLPVFHRCPGSKALYVKRENTSPMKGKIAATQRSILSLTDSVLGASAPAMCQTHTLITSRLCSPGCADTHL